jgi:hypothetical protein
MWCGNCYTCAPTPEFHIEGDDRENAGDEEHDRISSGWATPKSETDRFLRGRNGDDLMTPFECDFCIFRKLYKTDPDLESEANVRAMACIRRINLDACWSRASSTVSGNASQIRQGLRLSASIGLDGPYYPPGPLPGHDHCGYEVAIQMVLASLEKGVYSSTHKQFDTIRRLRSSYSNQIRASAIANSTTLTLADNQGSTYSRLASDPCGSLWFQRFMVGCKKRMGQDWRPNRAVSVEIMGDLLENVERRALLATKEEGRHRWIMAGGYFCFCFVLSLRSSEGLLADLEGLLQYFDVGCTHVVIPLLGRFKGEDHSTQHLMHCTNTTDSGIQVKTWIRRLLAVHESRSRSKGPVFINSKGAQSTTSEMNTMFIECLSELFEENKPGRFGIDIHTTEDVANKYHVFRSFRRGSESRAVAMKVDEADRYVVNRWRKKEAAGVNRVNHSIGQHYVDITQVSPSFLRYTQAM